MSEGATKTLQEDSANDFSLVSDDVVKEGNDSWIDNVMDAMTNNALKKKLHNAAKVHPCIIDGDRVLVYEKGLKKHSPEAFEELLEFAEGHDFALKEDQRDPEKNRAGVLFERRMAKTAPMMLLAGGLLMNGVSQAETAEHSYVMPDIEVLGETESSERAYLVRDGKRFIAGPYGEVEAILAVAAEAKEFGELKRVSTRNIHMPQDYVGGYINRYDYQFPESCGGAKYSYYEGDGFGALGYHYHDKVVMDVLVGGGAFAAPKLWGPYDQVLYDNHEMQLVMGNGKQDGMGLLKASYSIGMTAIMADEDFQEYGSHYKDSVQQAVHCVEQGNKKKPVIHQASLDNINRFH